MASPMASLYGGSPMDWRVDTPPSARKRTFDDANQVSAQDQAIAQERALARERAIAQDAEFAREQAAMWNRVIPSQWTARDAALDIEEPRPQNGVVYYMSLTARRLMSPFAWFLSLLPSRRTAKVQPTTRIAVMRAENPNKRRPIEMPGAYPETPRRALSLRKTPSPSTSKKTSPHRIAAAPRATSSPSTPQATLPSNISVAPRASFQTPDQPIPQNTSHTELILASEALPSVYQESQKHRVLAKPKSRLRALQQESVNETTIAPAELSIAAQQHSTRSRLRALRKASVQETSVASTKLCVTPRQHETKVHPTKSRDPMQFLRPHFNRRKVFEHAAIHASPESDAKMPRADIAKAEAQNHDSASDESPKISPKLALATAESPKTGVAPIPEVPRSVAVATQMAVTQDSQPLAVTPIPALSQTVDVDMDTLPDASPRIPGILVQRLNEPAHRTPFRRGRNIRWRNSAFTGEVRNDERIFASDLEIGHPTAYTHPRAAPQVHSPATWIEEQLETADTPPPAHLVPASSPAIPNTNSNTPTEMKGLAEALSLFEISSAKKNAREAKAKLLQAEQEEAQRKQRERDEAEEAEKREREARAAEEEKLRKAIEEQERLKKEREEQEMLKKEREEQETLRRETEEMERLWREIEEQERLRRETEEQEKLQREVEEQAQAKPMQEYNEMLADVQREAEEQAQAKAMQEYNEMLADEQFTKELEEALANMSELDDTFNYTVDERVQRPKLALPLTKAWEAKIIKTLAVRDEMQKVGPEITRGELARLLPSRIIKGGGGWLNDTCINTYLELMTAKASEVEGYDKSDRAATPAYAVLNSNWSGEYSKKGASGLTRWFSRKRIDGKRILKTKKILFPINKDANHWTLLVVDTHKRTLHYLDSFNAGGEVYVQAVKEMLKFQLKEDYQEKEWTVVGTASSAQSNGKDCGMFVNMNALAAVMGYEDPRMGFAQEDIANARKWVAAVLINGGFSEDLDLWSK